MRPTNEVWNDPPCERSGKGEHDPMGHHPHLQEHGIVKQRALETGLPEALGNLRYIIQITKPTLLI